MPPMHNGFAKELARFGPQAATAPIRLAEARAYCSQLARTHNQAARAYVYRAVRRYRRYAATRGGGRAHRRRGRPAAKRGGAGRCAAADPPPLNGGQGLAREWNWGRFYREARPEGLAWRS